MVVDWWSVVSVCYHLDWNLEEDSWLNIKTDLRSHRATELTRADTAVRQWSKRKADILNTN